MAAGMMGILAYEGGIRSHERSSKHMIDIVAVLSPC